MGDEGYLIFCTCLGSEYFWSSIFRISIFFFFGWGGGWGGGISEKRIRLGYEEIVDIFVVDYKSELF